PFETQALDRTVIAIPLLRILEKEIADRKKDPSLHPQAQPVVIDLNLEFPEGRDAAREWVIKAVNGIIKRRRAQKKRTEQNIDEEKSNLSPQYLFARLEGDVIRELVNQDRKENAGRRQVIGVAARTRAIYHIWPDFPIRALTVRSISTVKADAARASFSALGEGIVWAVMD